MGVQYYKRVWSSSKAKGSHKLTMLAIAELTNENTGRCDPSHETLADMVGVTTRQIRKILDDLADSNELEVVTSRGRNHTNQYNIMLKIGTPVPVKEENIGTAEPILDEENRFCGSYIDDKIGTPASENRNSSSYEPIEPINNTSNEVLRTASADAPATVRSAGKKPKRTKPTSTNAEKPETPEQQQWFGAVCWLVHGHKDCKLLSKEDRLAIGQTVKAIRESSEQYTIDDLRTWYSSVWSRAWPGLQKNGCIQKPRLKDIRSGIGQVRAVNRPPPAVLNSNGNHTGMSVFSQDFQGSEA